MALELGADPERPRKVDGSGSPVPALSVAHIHEAHRTLLAAGVAPRMAPTEMAPGIFMIFLRGPDGRPIELAQFADGATCSAEYTRAQG